MNNLVELSGKVISDVTYSHSILGEKYYLCTLSVMRGSGVCDELTLHLSENLGLIELKNLKNKYVYVTGELRSRNIDMKVDIYVLVNELKEIDVLKKNKYYGANYISLNGYICKIFPLRYTKTNRVICNIILAINRTYGRCDYIPCIIWGKNAKNSEKFCVGDNVEIVGRLQSRKYIKNEIEHITYEVSVQEIGGITNES